ncbi:MAG: 2-phosphosulfolactate phosphatase [bacterium]|nr:2-phosphosulfolactate phosphatase [bacterium]
MRRIQPRVDFGWGLRGLQSLLATSDVVVIVDVLSFSTAVDVATSRGARILPFPYGHTDAESYARSRGAVLAQPRLAGGEQLNLSPETLKAVASGTRIVLPSPNGSRLSRETGAVPTLAGCLRNATAVAQGASSLGGLYA